MLGYKLLLIALLLAAGLFFSCSRIVVQEVDIKEPFISYQRPTGNPTVQSIELYTLGEQAIAEQNYRFALMLLQQADVFDPTNVTIKERILHTKLIKAEADSSFYKQVVELGNKYVEADLITPELYRYTARAHIHLEDIERGILLKKLALQIDPDPFHYYDLFFYLARHEERLEFIYLEKALERGWNHPRLIIAIANIYEHRIPLRSKEILEKAYELYHDDQSLVESLLNFYRRFNDWDSFRIIIDDRLSENRSVKEEYLKLYLEHLFAIEDYHRVQEIAHLYRFMSDKNVKRKLFYAAFYSEDYRQTIQRGEDLLLQHELSSDEISLIKIYTGKAYYYLGKVEETVTILSKINDPLLLLGVFQVLSEKERAFELSDFVEGMIDKGLESPIGYFIIALHSLGNNDQQGFDHYLNRALLAEADDKNIWKTLAVILLHQGYDDKAKESLGRYTDSEHEQTLLMGEYYYYIEDDSQAIKYIKKSLELIKEPEPDAFLTLASLYNRNNKHNQEIELMEKAAKIHREDPLILNWLGYTLVAQTDRYDEAKEYLLRAIELNPDRYHIQDSVAWLYYKLNDYDRALYYMKDIIEDGVRDSIVSYHIGMIYLRLDEKERAIEYLEKALQLNNDDEAVAKSREVLASIGE